MVKWHQSMYFATFHCSAGVATLPWYRTRVGLVVSSCTETEGKEDSDKQVAACTSCTSRECR